MSRPRSPRFPHSDSARRLRLHPLALACALLAAGSPALAAEPETPAVPEVQADANVATVTITPRGGHPALEVELRDGSGAVTLLWLGRRQIPGIDPGRTIKVWGRISCHEGRRLMYNPRYELFCTQRS